jgi:hypothetical protein
MQEHHIPQRSNTPMKKQIFSAVVLAALTLVGVYAYLTAKANNVHDDDASNAAFQDGMSSGAQDARSGEEPHLVIARWSAPSDRNAFVEGYQVAYEETLPAVTPVSPPQSTSAAYCDGLYLGKLDAAQGREAHITVGRWTDAQDKQSFASAYRHAYLDEMASRVKTNKAPQTALVEARN